MTLRLLYLHRIFQFSLLHRVPKNCAFSFLPKRCQISMNFNKFWWVDGKVANLVCYIYIFHQTWPMSLHYLVKSGFSIFLPNTGFVTIRLLRFGVKVKRTYCRDSFLAQKPLSDMRRLSGNDFLCNNTAARRINTTPSLSWSEREIRKRVVV